MSTLSSSQQPSHTYSQYTTSSSTMHPTTAGGHSTSSTDLAHNPVIHPTMDTATTNTTTTTAATVPSHSGPLQVSSHEEQAHLGNVAMPPTSQSNYAPNTSLYHQAKRAIMGVKSEFDNEYLSLRHHHEEINTVLMRLQSHFGRYIDLSKSALNESNAITKDMASLLTEPSAQYSQSISTAADVHYEMAVSAPNTMMDSLMSPEIRTRIDDAISRCRDLGRRMKDHEEFKMEVDYYGRKIDKLRSEKSNLPPGTQKPKLDERLDRNISKYETMYLQYAENHSKLMHELSDLWLNRAQILGPIFATFISVERDLAKRQLDMLSTIDLDKFRNIPTASLSSYPSSTASPANYTMIKKPTHYSEDIIPASTEHSVSEGQHLDDHDEEQVRTIPAPSGRSTESITGVGSTIAATTAGSALSNGPVPVEQQPPMASEVSNTTKTKPIAPPRPPRPGRYLTLAPHVQQPGTSDDSPLTPLNEVPPYKSENQSIGIDNGRILPANPSVARQIETTEAQMSLPRSINPLHDAAQPLLKSTNEFPTRPRSNSDVSHYELNHNQSAGQHDPHVKVTEPDQPVRTLSDLIRKNSRSSASQSDLQKEGSTYLSDHSDKAEDIHLSSESRGERQERHAAVFAPSYPQQHLPPSSTQQPHIQTTHTQTRSNIIEYI